MPRAKASRRTGQGPSRGTFDRGDLKEVAGSIRYGATINFLCNESLAVGLRALHETNSALRYVATRPEDITPALAVAGGHFVQVRLWEVDDRPYGFRTDDAPLGNWSDTALQTRNPLLQTAQRCRGFQHSAPALNLPERPIAGV